MHLRRIEEASLNAWPALHQLLFDGWILRFSRGFTKRANSVNPLYTSGSNVDDKISICERLYTDRGLPTIFRLSRFSQPRQLDDTLAQRRYHRFDITSVLSLNLAGLDLSEIGTGALGELEIEEWLDTFSLFQQTGPAQHHTHKEILCSIPSRRLLAAISDGNRTVACGLGVLESGYFGLFDLITDPKSRRRGHGSRLVSGMLRWARDHGASLAYLQVMRSNDPARRMYERFGFQEAYEYWYRSPEAARVSQAAGEANG